MAQSMQTRQDINPQKNAEKGCIILVAAHLRYRIACRDLVKCDVLTDMDAGERWLSRSLAPAPSETVNSGKTLRNPAARVICISHRIAFGTGAQRNRLVQWLPVHAKNNALYCCLWQV